MRETFDVAVVGGGIIGCAVAAACARRGLTVVVLERDRIGGGASGAAAGMLAPFVEATPTGPFFELCTAGLDALRDGVPALEAETGMDSRLSICGILKVAGSEAEAQALQRRAGGLAEFGVRWLDATACREMEPELSPSALGGLHSPREGCVSGAELTRAFAASARMRSAVLLENAGPVRLVRERDSIVGAACDPDEFSAGVTVLAGGAWSADCAAGAGFEVPVEPVRGQMVNVAAPRPAIRRILWDAGVYLVPQPDGSISAGATVERAGFDDRVTTEGVSSLLAQATALVPSLADATFRRAWSGLRPGTPDGMPILGPVPGVNRVLLATGHYRNGILLSALTGEQIADWISSGEEPMGGNPFSLARFAARSPAYPPGSLAVS